MESDQNYKESIIQKKSFDFALKIVKLYSELAGKKDNTILKQLLRSATSIGANVNEGSAGQTKRDFITKMSISSKEARETVYWLKLLIESDYYNKDLRDYLDDAESLVKILNEDR